VWCNPAFATSMSRSEQSERIYVADVMMPLLRATLENFPNSNLCLKDSQNWEETRCYSIGEVWKEDDDVVKLWREALDRISYVSTSYRPAHNQFGIVGIKLLERDTTNNRYTIVHETSNMLIINLRRALEQANTNLSRNIQPSPTISSLCREEQKKTRAKKISDMNHPLHKGGSPGG
ncbi:11950_t:CDS:2, partial [Racocetra persica]